MTWLFLILAVVAALFAYTGLASGIAVVAGFLFWVFAVLFLATLFARVFRRGPRAEGGSTLPRDSSAPRGSDIPRGSDVPRGTR